MNWPKIFTVFGAGVTAAFLIGKAPAALPVLRSELSLTLFEAGLVVAMFALLAAMGGLFIGALSDRFGQRRLAVVGLMTTIVSGAVGAFAPTPELLIASRVGEGVGFFMMSVSLPGIIGRLANDSNRQLAMGLWGAYLPLGAGLIMLAGGLIMAEIGWRGLWLAICAAGALVLLPLLWAAPAPTPAAAQTIAFGQRLRTVLRARGALLLAVTFGCYSGQYIAVTSFLPLILVERAGWMLPAAATVGAIVMLANVTGNIAAGLLLNRGVARATLLVWAVVAMALGSVLVMTESFPVALRITGAILFSSVGGLIPGALFAGVARHAPSESHISSVNGLMLQSVAIGQLLGPVATTYLVHQGGGDWHFALFYLLPMSVLTAIAAVLLGRLERQVAPV